MDEKTLKEKALHYHKYPKPGKLGTQITKSLSQKSDFALAYSPGVAQPCLEIQQNKETAYEYTGKGNTVAIISNGTAVLGLGDIGSLASKPVMEGKALLMKYLSGIDGVDIEVDSKDNNEIINFLKIIAETFGGINLEDVGAPACFIIDEAAKEQLDIPFFHDDQHGTAVVTAAAIQNALHLAGKKLQDCKIVVNGAGAAALACTNLLVHIGASKKNIYILDSKGLITTDREVDKYKAQYAQNCEAKNLSQALVDADIFLGLSKGNVLTKEDIKQMAKDPIILAMANPTPEIMPQIVKEVRDDAIVGTGRGDYPNQVNNVLCFPFLFRGALDSRAKKISIKMQMACCAAIAELAREHEKFGKDYIVPHAFDPLLLYKVSSAVVKTAREEGLAHINPENKSIIENEHAYFDKLNLYTYGSSLDQNVSIPAIGNEEAKDLVRILKLHGITKTTEKKLFALSTEEIIEKAKSLENATIVFKHAIVGFNNKETLQTNDIEKTINEMQNQLLGLITDSEILFDMKNRIWYAHILCK